MTSTKKSWPILIYRYKETTFCHKDLQYNKFSGMRRYKSGAYGPGIAEMLLSKVDCPKQKLSHIGGYVR